MFMCYFKYVILLLVILYSNLTEGQKGSFIKSQRYGKQKLSSASISGYFDDMRPDEQVILRVWPEYITHAFRDKVPTTFKEFKQKNNSGHFKFNVEGLSGPVYFSVLRPETREHANTSLMEVIDSYIVEPGDDIHCNVERGGYSFYGIGSAKLNVIYRFNSFRDSLWNNWVHRASDTSIKPLPINYKYIYGIESMVNNLKIENGILSRILDSLKTCKIRMSEAVYSLVRSDMIEATWESEIREYRMRFLVFPFILKSGKLSEDDVTMVTLETSKFVDFYKKEIGSFKSKWSSFHLDPRSKFFIDLLVMNTETDCVNENNKGRAEAYDILKRDYSDDIKDRAITVLFLTDISRGGYGNPIQNQEDLVQHAYYLVIKNSQCKKILQPMLKQGMGDLAYMFRLRDINDRPCRMMDFKGKVVFIDFWYTGCEFCKLYYQNELSNAERYFQDDSDVVFVSISIDKAKNRWVESVKSNTYSSPNAKNVVNLCTDGKGSEHPIIDYYKVFAYPRPLLIDKSGRIYSKSEADLRDKDKLIKNIIAAREN